MYTIKIQYQTGDSFRTEEAEDKIGMTWDNIELAKQALKDIESHNIYFDRYNKKKKKGPWFNVSKYDNSGEYTLSLLKDDGTRGVVSAFWRGYFERLIGAEIIVDLNLDKLK